MGGDILARDIGTKFLKSELLGVQDLTGLGSLPLISVPLSP
jgi:hypothetical protein